HQSQSRSEARDVGAGAHQGAVTPNIMNLRQPMQFLFNSLLELITQTSTNLPPDVRAAMALTTAGEKPATQSAQALGIILANIDMAVGDEQPICQDTGMPTFVVHTPVGVNQIEIRKAIRAAVAEATKRG